MTDRSSTSLALMTCILTCGLFQWQMTTGVDLPPMKVPEETLSIATDAVAELLTASTKNWCTVGLITDGRASPLATYKLIQVLKPQFGLRIFETFLNERNKNTTRQFLATYVQEVNTLRKTHECVTLLVVSDDGTFLDLFASTYIFDLLLVWKQRPMVITSTHNIKAILQKHWVLFANSGMAIYVPVSKSNNRLLSVLTHSPYGPEEGGQVIRVATWSRYQGLISTPPEEMFQKTFDSGVTVSVKEALKDPISLGQLIQSSRTFRFKIPVEAVVAVEQWSTHVVYDNSEDNYKFYGGMANLLYGLAKAMNFTYKLQRPADGQWGSRNADGSWTGLIGLVHKQEADFALGPHDVTLVRSTAIDNTIPMVYDSRKFVVAQNRAAVDPWGFLFPLSSIVWMGTLLTLGIVAAMTTVIGVNYRDDPLLMYAVAVVFHTYRLLLQQGITMSLKKTSERIMVMSWLIGAMIIYWSYSTNLMSILAVRYAPKPIQTIRDLLNDDNMIVIFPFRTALSDYVNSVESGQLKEVSDLVKVDRYIDVPYQEFPQALENMVRFGTHVLATDTLDSRRMIAHYFTKTGVCQFYIAEEAFVTYAMAMVVQKGSPMVKALSYRVLEMMEGGLYDYWLTSYLPNSTSCRHMPSVFTVKEPLALTNIWGVFVLLTSGIALAALILCLEKLVKGFSDSNPPPMSHLNL